MLREIAGKTKGGINFEGGMAAKAARGAGKGWQRSVPSSAKTTRE